jgi:hypothetical protein
MRFTRRAACASLKQPVVFVLTVDKRLRETGPGRGENSRRLLFLEIPTAFLLK